MYYRGIDGQSLWPRYSTQVVAVECPMRLITSPDVVAPVYSQCISRDLSKHVKDSTCTCSPSEADAMMARLTALAEAYVLGYADDRPIFADPVL